MSQNTHWFNSAIIYHILIDRFAGFLSTKHWEKPVFLGGTLHGITEKLPYLKDLGINTLWISPFYQTSAYHGYHITDFFQVDPHYGTLQDLKTLIERAHQYNMRIIADFVPNHCSKEHPYFKNAQQEKNSSFFTWFSFTQWPEKYVCFLSVKEIPKINLNNSDARQHIIAAAEYWLGFGLDGYRLDHVIGPTHEFWKEFTQKIKTKFPDCVLLGEAWMQGIKRHELRTINVSHKYLKWLHGAASDSLFQEYVGLLDGVLDFRVQQLLQDHYAYKKTSPETFKRLLQHHYKHFPETFYLPAFLDNHDMNRFLFTCGNNKEKLKQAVRTQFSLTQPVIIYYGTETGMTQTKSLWDIPTHGDLQARQPMNWESPDRELFEFYKQNIIQKRH